MLDQDTKDLTGEEWREYEWPISLEGYTVVHRIENPVTLFTRDDGGTTHKILGTEGVVTCVPAPGYFGCVLRWKPRELLDRSID